MPYDTPLKIETKIKINKVTEHKPMIKLNLNEKNFGGLWDTGSMITTWKESEFGAILDCIFPHLDWIRANTLHISKYYIRMRENEDQNKYEYGHFLRSGSAW